MKYILCLLAIVALVGCASVDPRTYPVRERGVPPSPTNVWHSIRYTPKTNLSNISLGHKINPIWWFGNVDDPVPPEWYRPGRSCRSVTWNLRNPFHNFTFYVIGMSDKDFVRSGTYPEETFDPYDGWDCAISKRGILRLPFVSYSSKRVRIYFGWRTGGNFGMKFIFGGG